MAEYTKEQILTQLSAMNDPRNAIVLMHSSLRSVGRLEGDEDEGCCRADFMYINFVEKEKYNA